MLRAYARSIFDSCVVALAAEVSLAKARAGMSKRSRDSCPIAIHRHLGSGRA